MRLEFAPEALEDIQETKHYIATVLKNRSAASRVAKMIVHNCKQLKDQPYLGMAVEARTGYTSDMRYLICESWLVFYRLQNDTVQIVRVIDCRTDYLCILFKK